MASRCMASKNKYMSPIVLYLRGVVIELRSMAIARAQIGCTTFQKNSQSALAGDLESTVAGLVIISHWP
jgi:hypothetical protein